MKIKRRKRIVIETTELTVIKRGGHSVDDVVCPNCGIHFHSNNAALLNNSSVAREVEAYSIAQLPPATDHECDEQSDTQYCDRQ